RAYEDGNLVLSHAWSHAQLTAKSPEQIQTELSRTENKLQEIIGQKPALVRPPYGDLNPQVADEFKRQGCKAVLWSVDTLDWSQREKANIVKNITDNIRPGDIILMHSDAGKTATVAALPVIIAELKNQGYQCVDLGELLGEKPYK
ncbi:MAG: polysaccharide deacetylase family protein, partial [Heliobacteriaceae bacterium]|nr:polysaccharide deacetylase family protein [Heliobacteriaceae bacterium]